MSYRLHQKTSGRRQPRETVSSDATKAALRAFFEKKGMHSPKFQGVEWIKRKAAG